MLKHRENFTKIFTSIDEVFLESNVITGGKEEEEKQGCMRT